MKFSISQASLLHMIQTVSKAVAVRTTKPVLTGILLEATEDRLTATAYDLELGIRSNLYSDETTKLQIEQTGSIVLTARYFADIVRKLPSDIVEIRVNNNYVTEIRSGQAEFHLHGIDAAEFPKLPVFERPTSIQITSTSLKDAILMTSFAASTLEVRPILTGIHLVGENERMTFTATDALRLATTSSELAKPFIDRWTGVLPSKSLSELAKILPDEDMTITVQFTESHSLFEIGATLFYTRLIDGSYPDTSRIIPSSHKTEVVLSTDDFLGSIDRAALIARDREVRMEIASSNVVISSSSPEVGNVSERFSAVNKTGDDLMISFNAKYVLDAVKALGTDQVIIYFNGSSQPFIIRSIGDESTIQLISPVLMR